MNSSGTAAFTQTADHTSSPPLRQQTELSFAETLVNHSTHESVRKDEFHFSSGFKRPLSDTSSEASNVRNNSPSVDSKTLHLKDFPSIPDSKIGMKQKKVRKEDTRSAEETSFSIASGLESARATIEATAEKHKLNFDKFVELLGKLHGQKREDKRSIVGTYTHNFSELTNLVGMIYSMTKGRRIKANLRSLKNSISIGSESLNDSSLTDTSMVSESD